MRSRTTEDLTALQLDVPGAELLLDAVEREGRRGVTLLRPAHISFGYPWLAPPDARLAIAAVASELAAAGPLLLRFEAVDRFGPDPKGRAVLHLVPEPAGIVRELARRIGVDLAEPHLSLARVTAAAAPGTADALAAVAAPLLPLETEVRTASFTVREGGRWRLGRLLPLGPAGNEG